MTRTDQSQAKPIEYEEFLDPGIVRLEPVGSRELEYQKEILLDKGRKVIGVYDANRVGPLEVFHAYKIVFLCDLIGGEARPSDETSAVAFFRLDEIPDQFSGERTRPRHIQDAFSIYTNPNLPTIFD